MSNNFFISADDLASILGNDGLSIVDASWYLPAQGRNGRVEYETARIPGAVYFDIDAIADHSSGLPHMMPDADAFSYMAGNIGISDTDQIVVYDGPGVFSSARVWWMFRTMGAKNVSILAGGFDRWKEAGLQTETDLPSNPSPKLFNATLNVAKIRSLDDMRGLIETKSCNILDARPAGRFTGEVPEPRAGLRSGHMPGATSLPFDQLIQDGKLRDNKSLSELLDKLIQDERPIVTSCGSGVTAAVITLALETIGKTNHSLYDGSWSEWGAADSAPVTTGQ